MTETPFHNERKFAISRGEAEAFFAQIGQHLSLEVYDRERPVAYTRTTYLDTDDLEYLATSDQPIMRRLRVREYAAAASVDEPAVLTGVSFLELKATAGAARAKARIEAQDVIGDLLAGSALDDGFCNRFAAVAADPTVRARLAAGELRPRITTWYRRASLVGDNGRIRITFDEGLGFARPTAAAAPGSKAEPHGLIAFGPGRLLELKFQGKPPRWLEQATAGLAEASGLSKYHLSMHALAAAPQVSRQTRPIAIPLRVRGG